MERSFSSTSPARPDASVPPPAARGGNMATGTRVGARGHSISARAAREYMKYAGEIDHYLWDDGLPRYAPAGSDQRRTRPFWEKLALDKYTDEGRKNIPASICGVASAAKRLADDPIARAASAARKTNVAGIVDELHPCPQRPVISPTPAGASSSSDQGALHSPEPMHDGIAVAPFASASQGAPAGAPSPTGTVMDSDPILDLNHDGDEVLPSNIDDPIAREDEAAKAPSTDEAGDSTAPKSKVRGAVEANLFGSGESSDDEDIMSAFSTAIKGEKDDEANKEEGDEEKDNANDSELPGDTDPIEGDSDGDDANVNNDDMEEDTEEKEDDDEDDGDDEEEDDEEDETDEYYSHGDDGSSGLSDGQEEDNRRSDGEYEDTGSECAHAGDRPDNAPTDDNYQLDNGAFYVRHTRDMRFACIVDIISRATGVTNRRLLDGMLRWVLEHDDSKWIGRYGKQQFDIGYPHMAAIPVALARDSASDMASALRANGAYTRYADRMDAWIASDDPDALLPGHDASPLRAPALVRRSRSRADPLDATGTTAGVLRARSSYSRSYVKRARLAESAIASLSSSPILSDESDAPPPPPPRRNTTPDLQGRASSDPDAVEPLVGTRTRDETFMPSQETPAVNESGPGESEPTLTRQKRRRTVKSGEERSAPPSSQSCSRSWRIVHKIRRRITVLNRRAQPTALAAERPDPGEAEPSETGVKLAEEVDIPPVPTAATLRDAPKASDLTDDEDDPDHGRDEIDKGARESALRVKCSSDRVTVCVRDILRHGLDMWRGSIQEGVVNYAVCTMKRLKLLPIQPMFLEGHAGLLLCVKAAHIDRALSAAAFVLTRDTLAGNKYREFGRRLSAYVGSPAYVALLDRLGHPKQEPASVPGDGVPSPRRERDTMDIVPISAENDPPPTEVPLSPPPLPLADDHGSESTGADGTRENPVRLTKRHRSLLSPDCDPSAACSPPARTRQRLEPREEGGEDCVDLTADVFPVGSSHGETQVGSRLAGSVRNIKRERHIPLITRGRNVSDPIKVEPGTANRRDTRELFDSVEPIGPTNEERKHDHDLVDGLAAQIGLKDERGKGDPRALCVWHCNRTTGEQKPVFAARRQWDSDDSWVVTYGTDSMEGAAHSAPDMFKWWRVRQLVCDRLLSPWTSVYVGLMTAPDSRKQIVSIVNGGFFTSCQRWISEASTGDAQVSLQEGERLLARAHLLCASAIDAEHGCECAQLRDRLTEALHECRTTSPP